MFVNKLTPRNGAIIVSYVIIACFGIESCPLRPKYD